jgi:predicted GNAT family acetyltransferase
VQGGDSQDQNLLQYFLNVVEWGMTPQQAAEAPNVNSYQMRSSFGAHESRPGRLLVNTAMPEPARAALGRMGYTLELQPRTNGPINAIWFDRATAPSGAGRPTTGRTTALAGESSDGRSSDGPVTVRHEPDATRWVAVVDGGEAELAYEVLPDGGLDLQHTLVPHESRGAGVADLLVRAAVTHARAEGRAAGADLPLRGGVAARHRDARGRVRRRGGVGLAQHAPARRAETRAARHRRRRSVPPSPHPRAP